LRDSDTHVAHQWPQRSSGAAIRSRGLGVAVLGLALGFTACARSKPAHNLDLDAIRISGDARLRTDVVGDGKFASTASFVLVDAENTAADGANVTLGGELTDATGTTVGTLKAQSLWIPGHAVRMFALVDTERVPRPTSTSARIKVFGAVIPDEPPRAQITELHTFDDRGKMVVQAYVENTAERRGQFMVIAAFHDAHGQPMTRPFQMIELAGRDRQVVQFVGPEGSTRGTIFLGDAVY
jgi:hypothetical protein